MILRKTAVLFAALAMILGAVAEAQMGPGRPRPPFPMPLPPLSPGPGPSPGPLPPPNQGGQRITRSIFVNRYVMNEALALRELAGLGWEFNDAILDSVQIDLRSRGDFGGLVELVLNNVVEDSVFNPQASGVLRPRGFARLGSDFYGLRLVVHDPLFIERISVTVREGGAWPGPQPSPQLNVPVQINAQMRGNSRIDLAGFVNLAPYRGYRIEAVTVEALASWNNALLDVVMNGFQQGTMVFDRSNAVSRLALRGAVIGAGAENLIFLGRGDLFVKSATLHLSR